MKPVHRMKKPLPLLPIICLFIGVLCFAKTGLALAFDNEEENQEWVTIIFQEENSVFEEQILKGAAYNVEPPQPRELDSSADFLGWGTGLSDPGKNPEVENLLRKGTVITDSITLQAFWGRNVVLDGAGGIFPENGKTQLRCKVGRGFALSVSAPVRIEEQAYPYESCLAAETHRFAGWTKEEIPCPEPYVPTENGEYLIAQWREASPTDTCKLIFRTDGGLLEPEEPIVFQVPRGSKIVRFPTVSGQGVQVTNWSPLADGGEIWLKDTPITQDLELWPIFVAQEFTIRFEWMELQEDRAVERERSITEKYNSHLSPPKAPQQLSIAYVIFGEDGIPTAVQAEYKLLGWRPEGADFLWNFETSLVKKDTALKAEYQVEGQDGEVSTNPADFVKITFYPKGKATGEGMESFFIKKGGHAGPLPPKEWHGHSFRWWSETDGGDPFDFSQELTEDMDLLGQWDVKTEGTPLFVELAPKEGGDILTPPREAYAPGEQVSLQVVSREGYRFDKWSVQAGTLQLTEEQKTSPALVFQMPADSLALVGHLKKVQSATTEIAGQGEIVPPPEGAYPVGEEVVFTAKPQEGYRFDHWEITEQTFTQEKRNRQLILVYTPTLRYTIPNAPFFLKAVFVPSSPEEEDSSSGNSSSENSSSENSSSGNSSSGNSSSGNSSSGNSSSEDSSSEDSSSEDSSSGNSGGGSGGSGGNGSGGGDGGGNTRFPGKDRPITPEELVGAINPKEDPQIYTGGEKATDALHTQTEQMGKLPDAGEESLWPIILLGLGSLAISGWGFWRFIKVC